MAYGAYIAALEQLIAAGETEFQSMNALKNRIEEIQKFSCHKYVRNEPLSTKLTKRDRRAT